MICGCCAMRSRSPISITWRPSFYHRRRRGFTESKSSSLTAHWRVTFTLSFWNLEAVERKLIFILKIKYRMLKHLTRRVIAPLSGNFRGMLGNSIYWITIQEGNPIHGIGHECSRIYRWIFQFDEPKRRDDYGEKLYTRVKAFGRLFLDERRRD